MMLAAGTPVLVSDAVGAADSLARPEDGELVPAGISASGLARRLEALLGALRVAPPARDAAGAGTPGEEPHARIPPPRTYQ